MPNLLEKLFKHGSKSNKAKVDPKLTQQAEKSQENLQVAIGDMADKANEEGNSSAAKECKKLSKKIENYKYKSEEDFKKFLDGIEKEVEKLSLKLKLSPENRRKLMRCGHNFRENTLKVARWSFVGKAHSKHVEKVILEFLREVCEDLSLTTDFVSYKLTADKKGIIVSENDFIRMIEEKINTSGLKNYAIKHPRSSICKWYKYLLGSIKKLREELKSYESELNTLYHDADQMGLVKKLSDLQKRIGFETYEFLDLLKFVNNNSLKENSIGKTVETVGYTGVMQDIKGKFDMFYSKSYKIYFEMVRTMVPPVPVS